MHNLNPKEIDSLEPGTHSDGGNLYLVVKDGPRGGSRAYMLRYSWQGRPEKMGLGATRDVTLKEARDKAVNANRLLANGINPKHDRDEKRRVQGSVLFGPFAEELRLKKVKGLKHEASKAKWKRTVEDHSKPLHNMRLDRITTADVEAVLQPIWLKTPVAARDVRQHLEAIFDAAKALKHCSGDNPAAWKANLKTLLPQQPKKGTVRGPHKSLDFEDMAQFMRELAAIDTVGARMLETCILTAVRTNEINNMRWSDTNMTKATWTVPASLTKNGKVHVVPLSRPVMTYLHKAYEMRFGDFVFPGRKRGAPMSGVTMLNILYDMPGRSGITVHGFRATFKTWCDEETNFSNQSVEFCLGHIPGDDAEKAYRRRSMLAKRVLVMEAWATHVKPSAKVVNIDQRKRAAAA